MDKRIKRILMLILVAIVLILGAVYCFTLHPTGGSGFEIEKVTPEDNAAVFCILTEDGWYQLSGLLHLHHHFHGRGHAVSESAMAASSDRGRVDGCAAVSGFRYVPEGHAA